MPNVVKMEERMQSHLARVSGRAMDKETARIAGLRRAGKISQFTAMAMLSTAAIRLAWLANAA